ncbi:hypothetical protein ACQP2F_01155 [Actinoplanes sp. CA-030573]|uniref:hypothetical protein n=1 Tax=Actinoplanes sp. CA-030573 TaxID=3239898 RepID=UPI003D9374FD
MTDPLGELTAVVAPPPPPASAFHQWDELAQRLGVTPPADYRPLVETYGPGVFDDFLHVLQPKSHFEAVRLVSFTTAYRERLRAQQASGRALPHDPDELVPIARTEDADVISWLVRPAGWTLVVNNASRTEWLAYDGGLTAFLADVFTRRLRMPFFPDDFPSAEPVFTPYPRALPQG